MAADGHDNLPATSYDLTRTFQGIDFKGKRVLDVGAGKGLMSLFAALSGAERVVSIEPEMAGARRQVLATLRTRIHDLALDNTEVLTEDFNTWDARGERF